MSVDMMEACATVDGSTSSFDNLQLTGFVPAAKLNGGRGDTFGSCACLSGFPVELLDFALCLFIYIIPCCLSSCGCWLLLAGHLLNLYFSGFGYGCLLVLTDLGLQLYYLGHFSLTPVLAFAQKTWYVHFRYSLVAHSC